MITVHLLGGIRKIVGTSNVNIDTTYSSLDDIITFLEQEYQLKKKLNDSEIIMAVNGVESSILGGRMAKISSGDVITILSVVHGG